MWDFSKMTRCQKRKNKMDRKQVYELIEGERSYQDKRWGPETTASGGRHYQPEEWIVFIEDYLTEAKHILAREAAPECDLKAMAIIRKIAAMCVAAMETIDTPARE